MPASTIRLLALILGFLLLGWAVKTYREHAHAEPVKVKAGSRRKS